MVVGWVTTLLWEGLEPLAVQKDFDWLFSGYIKTRRGQGPDMEGLTKFHAPLEAIVLNTPRGIPNFRCLKETIRMLGIS